MWPVKPKMDKQSNEPGMQSSFKKKHVPLSKDNNCKSTRIYNKSKCYDKNCQEKENNVMWSVTKETDMQLPKPATRRLCSDKSCQSTRCSSLKKQSPRRPMYDKNCQL